MYRHVKTQKVCKHGWDSCVSQEVYQGQVSTKLNKPLPYNPT